MWSAQEELPSSLPHLGAGPKAGLDRKIYPRLSITFIFILMVTAQQVLAKETVIFEQIGQLARVTAYLHVHVELTFLLSRPS
jgi:hypothetical protein